MAGDSYGESGAGPSGSYMPAEPQSDEKTWAMACHVSGFVGYLPQVPIGGIIGPLVVWLLKKDSSRFVEEHGKESLNFQITMAIACAINWVLFFSIIFTLIAIPLMGLLGLWNIVLVIVASIKALNGEPFHYPLTIRFLK
jgi:uncharacterized Tic20 family protein